MKHIGMPILCLFMIGGCVSIDRGTITPDADVPLPTSTSEASHVLFDDFSYSAPAEMTANGWVVRNGSGWPGVPGATFRAENVSFVDYPDQADNRLLRMTSSTDGTGENTYQTQICH